MNFLFLHLKLIWSLMLGGVISGAGIGLRFHEAAWLGGYNSFRRRLMRLGHISFFGLAFVNGIFVLTLTCTPINPNVLPLISFLLTLGSILMPSCCFVASYQPQFKILFPLPTLALALAIILTLSFSF